MSMGGRFVPAEDDDADTPNTQAFMCQWAGRNLMFTFEVRHWYTNSEAGMREKYPFVEPTSCVGEIFFGSEGYMIIPDYSSYYTFLGPITSRVPSRPKAPLMRQAMPATSGVRRAFPISAIGPRRSEAASTKT